jgi:hypothetical protein
MNFQCSTLVRQWPRQGRECEENSDQLMQLVALVDKIDEGMVMNPCNLMRELNVEHSNVCISVMNISTLRLSHGDQRRRREVLLLYYYEEGSYAPRSSTPSRRECDAEYSFRMLAGTRKGGSQATRDALGTLRKLEART